MISNSDEKIPRIQYTADGLKKTFETSFALFKPDAVQVFFNQQEVAKTLYTTYLDSQNRGYITFKTAPQNGTVITIVRNLPLECTTQFQSGGALRAKSLNYEFNYQMGCIQQIADRMKRSMVLPVYAGETDTSLTLPYPVAGKAIIWSSDGKSLENSEVEINAISRELDEKVNIATSAIQTVTQASDTAVSNAAISTEKAQIATQKAEEAITIVENKADIDLANAASTSGLRRLTETWSDANGNWYKVFEETNPITGEKRNWCEQGGTDDCGTAVAQKIITLLKPYNNTQFKILALRRFNSEYALFAIALSGSTFNLSSKSFGGSGQVISCFWKTEGYIS